MSVVFRRVALLVLPALVGTACTGGTGGGSTDDVADASDDAALDTGTDAADVGQHDGGADAVDADADMIDASDASPDSDVAVDVDADTAGDAQGDVDCRDGDSDGACDDSDNCPVNFNPDQADVDGDGQGDVCDAAPGTVGEAPADGIAVVPEADADELVLEWNSEVTVRITGPLEQATYTLIVAEPGDGEFARYTLYRSADPDTAIETPATVTFRIPNAVSDAMTAVRYATSTLIVNRDDDEDGAGNEEQLARCELDLLPCAATSGIDLDENEVPEELIVVADVVRTGGLALTGALPADPVPDFVTPASWWEVTEYAGQGDPDMATATWDDAIELQPAWLATSGGPLVAVIADGFDSTDTDVPFVNASGVGVLINGYDFVSGDADSSVAADTVGTAVAGIIAAELDGAGITGMAYSSDILAIRGMGGTVLQMASAVEYAVAQGAKVVLVVGGTDTFFANFGAVVQQAAADGALVVASTGTFGGSVAGDRLRYPAAFDTVLAVAGLGTDGQLEAASRFGDWVDMAAPAVDILTSVPDGAVSNDGTHYAAAMVAGAAALVWQMNPDWTPDEVREQLISTGDAIPMLGDRGNFPSLNVRNATVGTELRDENTWLMNGGCHVGLPDFLTESGLVDLGAYDGSVMWCSSGAPGVDQGRAVLPLRISGDVDWHLLAGIAVCTEETLFWPGAGYNDVVQITVSSGGGGRPTTLLRVALDEVADWHLAGVDGRVVYCSQFFDFESPPYTAATQGITATVYDGGDNIIESWLLLDYALVVPE